MKHCGQYSLASVRAMVAKGEEALGERAFPIALYSQQRAEFLQAPPNVIIQLSCTKNKPVGFGREWAGWGQAKVTHTLR